MHFIHYKDFPPVNLSKVGTIGKENQHVTKEAMIFAIGFYEFERKIAYWVFQSEQERDRVFESIRSQVSKEIPAQAQAAKQPAFIKS